MSVTIDGLKAAADVLRAADKIPEYQQILDAMATIADLRTQLSESQGRVRSLEAELEAIRADQKRADGIKRQGDLYVLDAQRYCPACWELHKRLAPVVTVPKFVTGGQRHFLQCSRCKQEFDALRNQ